MAIPLRFSEIAEMKDYASRRHIPCDCVPSEEGASEEKVLRFVVLGSGKTGS
jgi:hypothetical protein